MTFAHDTQDASLIIVYLLAAADHKRRYGHFDPSGQMCLAVTGVLLGLCTVVLALNRR